MYPTQLEITFSYINDDNKKEHSQNFDLPHSLDMPNHPKLRNDKIIFF
ncbi:hypothetical protein ABXT43_00925 [Candidatus Pelagibacter sp. Uisw_114]